MYDFDLYICGTRLSNHTLSGNMVLQETLLLHFHEVGEQNTASWKPSLPFTIISQVKSDLLPPSLYSGKCSKLSCSIELFWNFVVEYSVKVFVGIDCYFIWLIFFYCVCFVSYFFRDALTILTISNDYCVMLVNVNYTTISMSVIHIVFSGIQIEIIRIIATANY